MTLRELRKDRGYTQELLATVSGVAQTSISALETGANKNPSYDVVEKLATALHSTPEFVARAIRASQEAAA